MEKSHARKSIPKSTRFEVFKRDSFTCQYCGAQAPDVILEVDHIVPVSKGGDNSLLNLVTSCRDCNRGKSNKNLSDSSAIMAQKKQLDDIQSRRELVQMMVEWKDELKKISDEEVSSICWLVESTVSEFGKSIEMTDIGRRDIKKLIRRFGFLNVYGAWETALDQYCKQGTDSEINRAFDMVGGICYNRMKKREQDAE